MLHPSRRDTPNRRLYTVNTPLAHIARCTWIALALLAILPKAHAQDARISLGVAGGANLPVSVSERFVPRFEDVDYGGTSAPTLLVHQRPRAGVNLQVEALIRTMHLRYRFTRNSWGADRLRCAPAADNTAIALRLPNGEFDDRAMTYDCDPERLRLRSDPARRALNRHQLLVGIEAPALPRWRVVPYASAGGGIVLTQYHSADQDSSIRLGLNVYIGGGFSVPIDKSVTLYLESHYALTLMARGGNYSLRAGRAVAANRTVLSAAIDPLHAFDIMAGIRLRIR